MTTDPHPVFVCLRDADLTLADPGEDIRGRRVVDEDGNAIGTVDDLGVNTEERRVRFLLVDTGGLSALGARTLLLPIGAVNSVGIEIGVGRLLGDGTGTPAYDPELIGQRSHGETVRTFNRVPPITGPGHMHPGPVRRRRGSDSE
ncbi:PRC-barrel domain-containing protein [Jiangella mangrovi]|uniref:Sporulation protein YlmC with PRC-barrel domain n=1 Tax=Jiangella mangrovi TaxID=1524084 RepID=A0A7W9LNR1_9ACTN|nr:PRC-barrel domain-containing protein [Jiangella mangrovi]MBB5790392.1 sporulation protein YlmC with PRC-barrel domain [Jiangella mangrovi]